MTGMPLEVQQRMALRHWFRLYRLQSKLLATTLVVGIGFAGAVTVTAARLSAESPQPDVNPTGEVFKKFHDRIAAYVALQQKLEKALPPLTPSDNTAKVDSHRQSLAARLREVRKEARQGELFGDAAEPIRAVLSKDQASRSPQNKKETLKEVPARQRPRVNGEYPAEAPLATVPALLLKRLPPVPEGLEYRYMDRDLILRDTHANLIADVLPAVLPPH